MREWTGIEIEEERSRLEQEAATILGFILFEYSQLDMELGLYLVWSNEGRNLAGLTKELENYNFNKRLVFLRKSAKAKFAKSPYVVKKYSLWLSEANRLRRIRNSFFHGRWGFSPTEQQVINVLGLPTSDQQLATSHTIEELGAVLTSLKVSRRSLLELRKLWPV